MAGNWNPGEEQVDLFSSVILSMCDHRQVSCFVYHISGEYLLCGRWKVLGYLDKPKYRNSIERSPVPVDA